MNPKKKSEAVTINPEILGGTPVFAGTRVPVQNLFDYLEGGYTVDQFLERFSWVSRDDVRAVLADSTEPSS
jgi:uncharacterized protein (DUF433 family)